MHIIWVVFRSEACEARNTTKAQIMLNQGRPNIEGRAKRSPNRKRSRPGMGARPGRGSVVQGEGLAGWLGVRLDGRFFSDRCRACGADSLPGR